MDVLLLSRLQFALTIMFHYLFPPLTIGLGVVLVYLEGQHLRTRDPIYHAAAKFWTKIFGLNFALGVVTGIVMEFEFGTNWAVYSRYVGDVFGSALAAEGIFAFFLESGFLSILLFGWDRVGPKMHFFATLMVCIGGIFSSVWIVVANSWQQTPAGFEIRDHVVNGITFQRAEITDFWAMLFNPSSMQRLTHVLIGAVILGAFFVMSISAWYILKGRHREFAERSFRGGLLLGTIASLGQLAAGHWQADNVAEYQPAKLAAFEGLYETEKGARAYVFGWPDDESRTVKYGLAVPKLLSWLVHQDPDATGRRAERSRRDLRQAAGVAVVSVVSPDGRDRHDLHRLDALRVLQAVARHIVSNAVAAVVLRLRGDPRLHGERSGLGRCGSRSPTVDRLSDHRERPACGWTEDE